MKVSDYLKVGDEFDIAMYGRERGVPRGTVTFRIVEVDDRKGTYEAEALSIRYEIKEEFRPVGEGG